ncbi:DUF2236 domain-containing protein [Pseudenhygromyxa sp. WMMC2535]|uniref:oxygenase MpaB family protein n=1 Tax=Pseudenhygromyxa sp. WMMC2535 TaxID=2712867 RepID=UPI0015963733|nr:oxygenase MpaB family protein [Pseudenhygromyxa sp. WMMC2535]NVB42292.1 DUF2236 domain-containing protein [Pseudenhygromyxa sp. WMMC2535]
MATKKEWLGTKDKFARLREIERLDLATEYRQIAGLSAADFQSIMFTQVYQGFLVTFAAPRMSRILAATGEVEGRMAKRAVDTALFTRAVAMHGVKHGEGNLAAKRVNAMHRRYPIHQEDFIAVGVDGALAQIRMSERFGWRPLIDKEREAIRLHYAKITRAYGGRGEFPGTVAAMERFWDRYKREQFAFEPQNERMAKVVSSWFLSLAPRPLRPFLRLALEGVADPDVLRACGLRVPSALERRLAAFIMRRVIGARDPLPDSSPDKLEALAASVYPDGYTLSDLGTFPEDQPAEHEGEAQADPPAGLACPHIGSLS